MGVWKGSLPDNLSTGKPWGSCSFLCPWLYWHNSILCHILFAFDTNPLCFCKRNCERWILTKAKTNYNLTVCLIQVTRSKILATTWHLSLVSLEDTWSVNWPKLKLQFWGQTGRKVITDSWFGEGRIISALISNNPETSVKINTTEICCLHIKILKCGNV